MQGNFAPAESDQELPPYAVVITSCGRFDLLATTLRSLLAHLAPAPDKIIVMEDSGDARVADAIKDIQGPIEIVCNEVQLGQMKSIDKAYAMVTTPYVFHCEDDWEFFRDGFLAESFAILRARSDVSMVGLRPRAELNKAVRDMPVERIGGVEYFALDPALHPEYFSYSFNPGLRRMSDAQALSPFAALGHEADVSYAFKKAGFRIANLQQPAVRHIGDGRHVDDPKQAKKARTPWEKLKRSFRKRMKRVSRLFGC